MTLTELPLADAYLIDTPCFEDDRGRFRRTFDAPLLARHGLENAVAQAATSTNPVTATLRGLHFQLSPAQEVKTVTCWQGSLFDVIVDLRSDSPTFRRWYGIELTAGDNKTLYVPRGFAHGFQTLEPNTVAHYTMSSPYAPPRARGIRWNTPELSISWPLTPSRISDRDQTLPSLSEFLASTEAEDLRRTRPQHG